MFEYFDIRKRTEAVSRAIGIALMLLVHGGVLLVCATSGLKYIFPPPPENVFVVDFTEEEEPPKPKITVGAQPRSESVDKTKPVELVQKSESPYEGSKPNLTTASANDNFGDVDVPELEREPELKPQASFPGMSKKDTSLTSPHAALDPKAEFKSGQSNGNVKSGKSDGEANVHLKGRSVVGNLQTPAYKVQESGIVVVTIWVNQYGTVEKAIAGADGTTVTDATLWAAARKAALETHFNQSGDAPAMQQGKITYIFKLK